MATIRFNQTEQLVSLIADSMDAVTRRQLDKVHMLGARYGIGVKSFLTAAEGYKAAVDFTKVEARVAATLAYVSVSCNDPRFRAQVVHVLAEDGRRADIETMSGERGNVSTSVLQPVPIDE